MRIKKLIAAAVIGVLTLSMVGCSSAKPSDKMDMSKPYKVTFAVINDYPPFEYKENGKLTGFDIELIEAIAKKENMQVEWKEMKFDGIIPALQAKQVDGAISAITINDKRKEVVDFADTYFKSGLSLVVKKDSAIQKLEDLKGKVIVAKQGTTGLNKANELATSYGATVRILQNDTDLYLNVESGQADATINDFPGAAFKIKVDGANSKLRILGEKLTGEDYGIAVTKGNKDLLTMLNDGLKKLQDSGEFKTLNDKYFASK